VAFLIRAVAALLPVALIAWLFGWIGLRLWRRRQRRAAPRVPAE